jgi:hypothetical protein
MFAWIKTITTAGNKLAKSLTELAATVQEVNQGLRAQVGLDRASKAPRRAQEALEHRNGPTAAQKADDAA